MKLFQKSKKKTDFKPVMVYAKITELKDRYMVYNAVKNERSWRDKRMDCDNQELEATKKNRIKKCNCCNLVSGEEKDLGKGDQLLIIERHNNTYSISAITCYEGDASIEINYCPLCR